ncbi:MAG: siderophore-interacting protein [Solirubrobacterales bacterium]
MPDSPTPKPVRKPILTTVVSATPLTSHMIRIVVTGEGLRDFPVGQHTDHYVKLQFPPPGAPYEVPFDPAEIKADQPRGMWPRQRTYSVRAWDADSRELTIDFIHHGDTGLAGPWAARARPGDHLQLVGPGGDYTPDPEADWHLFVGDEAAIPAITVSLERIPEGVTANVFLEVEDESEVLEITSPGNLNLTWLYRNGSPHDQGSLLLDAISELVFPEGRVHAFVHGEAGMVRELRKHLLLERGIEKSDLSATGYWKYSRTEEGWREDKPEWKRQAELDVTAG